MKVKICHSIKIFFDPRDKTWVAISDVLPGCSAGGDTPQEALAEFEIAVDAWLEAREKSGLKFSEHSAQIVSA